MSSKKGSSSKLYSIQTRHVPTLQQTLPQVVLPQQNAILQTNLVQQHHPVLLPNGIPAAQPTRPVPGQRWDMVMLDPAQRPSPAVPLLETATCEPPQPYIHNVVVPGYGASSEPLNVARNRRLPVLFRRPAYRYGQPLPPPVRRSFIPAPPNGVMCPVDMCHNAQVPNVVPVEFDRRYSIRPRPRFMERPAHLPVFTRSLAQGSYDYVTNNEEEERKEGEGNEEKVGSRRRFGSRRRKEDTRQSVKSARKSKRSQYSDTTAGSMCSMSFSFTDSTDQNSSSAPSITFLTESRASSLDKESSTQISEESVSSDDSPIENQPKKQHNLPFYRRKVPTGVENVKPKLLVKKMS